MLSSLGSSSILIERYGEGALDVVALHGWGRGPSDFSPVLEGFCAAAVALPGFGTLEPPPKPWRPSEYAQWLAEALDPQHPVVLLGHSFGGRIAVRLAARYPQLVRALVLTGVPMTKLHPAKGPDWRYALLRSLRGMGLIPEARMEAARRKFGSADYRAATGVMREILVQTVAEDYLEDAATLSMPVELVWGEFDHPAPLEVARRTLEVVPHARLTVVAGSEHLLDQALCVGLRDALGRVLGKEAV